MSPLDNPKVSETMRDIVDGSIELVLRDNGKHSSSPAAAAGSSAAGDAGDMPRGFSLIFVENEFEIAAEDSFEEK